MKTKISFYVGIFIIVIFSSCSTTSKFGKSHKDVSAFIGNWVGESRADGELRTWVQRRNADGTYVVLFISIEDKIVTRNIESGKWWIENGKFYEISPKVMDKPDIYSYRIISKSEIEFENTTVDYKFTDKRIEENYFDEIDL